MEIVLSSAIPTNSASNCIRLDDDLYFASNTLLFKLNQGKFEILAQVDGVIRDFSISGNSQLIMTDEKIIMMHQNNKIGNLKRESTCFAANSDYFAIGRRDNSLEVWKIPKVFKFNLFERLTKFTGISDQILQLQIRNHKIISISADFGIRIHNIETGTSQFLWKSRSTPIYCNFTNNGAVIVNKNSIIHIEGDYSTHEIFKNDEILQPGRISVAATSFEDILVVVALNENKMHEFTVFNGKTKILTRIIELKEPICSLSLFNYTLAIKTTSGIIVRDLQLNIAMQYIPLPNPVAFDTYNDYCCIGCADKRLRVYKDCRLLVELADESFKGNICQVFIHNISCYAISDTGYVSIYNFKDSVNYKSFALELPTAIAQLNEDGSIMMAGDRNAIHIVDLKRGTVIDKIEIPNIIDFKCYRECIYALDIEGNITKYGIFNESRSSIKIEKSPTALQVKQNRIMVATASQCITLDTQFRVLNSFALKLEGRLSTEVYRKNKVATSIDFNANLACFSGKSNFVQFYDNGILDEFQISTNKDFDNYKKILGQEKLKFQGTIACLGLRMSEREIYVHTTEGIFTFKEKEIDASSLEFAVETSPEFIRATENELHALIGAIKLGDYKILQEVFYKVQNVPSYIKLIPSKFIERFLTFLYKEITISSKLSLKIKIYRCLRAIRKHFPNIAVNMIVPEEFKYLKESYYMLKVLIQ